MPATEFSDPSYRPAVRAFLEARPHGDGYVLADRRGIGDAVGLTRVGLELVKLINGRRTLREIQAAAAAQFDGQIVPYDGLAHILAGLDEALLLDGPTWQAKVAEPVRPPSCIGAYPADPAALRERIQTLFTAPGGAGLPGTPTRHGRLRAILAPHMDYGRGNVTYGHAFRELVEATAARTFVVVATSHHSPARFTLSRQNFATPLGVVPTHQAYIDRLVAHYGDGLFDDPGAHFPEHSIELELPFLQTFLGNDVRIVPLLVGSFHDCVEDATLPSTQPDIARMIEALRRTEAEMNDSVCYIISGDLAHIGPKFDDPEPVHDAQLKSSRAADELLLDRLTAVDADGYFRGIAAEADARRICGLPPTYVTLQAAQPTRGRTLHYQQYVHPTGHESVSFAAAAWYD